MPHMIDKHIMEELQQMWWPQYDATSSHRFRYESVNSPPPPTCLQIAIRSRGNAASLYAMRSSGKDMQMAFAYFYYVMNAHPAFDP